MNRNDNKEAVFRQFAEKARKRIEERKKRNTRQFYIGDADVTVTLHGLTEEEISESMEMYENSLESDKYVIYLACNELQEASRIMVEAGELKEHERYKIADMFSLADRRALAGEVLALSGMNGESSMKAISETEEIKN